MDIQFQYSAALMIPLLIIAVGIGLWLYYRDRRLEDLPMWSRWTLTLFRTTVVFLIGVFLLEPLLQYLSRTFEDPLIIVLDDRSESVYNLEDSTFLNRELPEHYKIIDDLDDTELEVLQFADGIDDDQGYNGKLTNLSKALKQVNIDYAGRNVAAVVVASDGLVNQGASPQHYPLNFNVPVFTLGLGSSEPVKDLSLNEVRANRLAYLGNEFPLMMRFTSEEIASEEEVSLEIKEGGKIVFSKEYQVTSAFQEWSELIYLEAKVKGIHRYDVLLKPVDGEWSVENNSRSLFVDVIDGRQKVLILSRTYHPDVAAIKEALLSSDDYEVMSTTYGKLADNIEVLKSKYNLVILHELPFVDRSSLDLISNMRAEGMPFWIITGLKTDLRFLNSLGLGLRISNNQSKSNEAHPNHNQAFDLFELDFDPGWFVDCPPLLSPFGIYEPSGGIQILLHQSLGNLETNQPLFYFNDVAESKTAILLGEGIWRWRLYDYQKNGNHDAFNSLTQKTVKFLATKDEKKNLVVDIPRSLTEQTDLVIEAEVYNQSFDPVTDPDVTVVIKDEDGAEKQYDLSRLDKRYRLKVGTLAPGIYNYEASTQVGGKKIVESGQFSVSAVSLERQSSRADHAMLRSWSQQTGGKFFSKEERAELVRELGRSDQIKPVAHAETKLVKLVDFKWIFFLLLALISVEWFVRKRNGVV